MSDWFQPSALVNFSSSMASAVDVSREGSLVLRANHFEAVSLTVSETCGSGVVGFATVFANLYPAVYDVDLGAASGAPFGVIQVNARRHAARLDHFSQIEPRLQK